jgi:P4 family phage/plasmid primase-like protien
MITSIKEFILSKGYDFEPETLDGKFHKAESRNGGKVWYIGSDLGHDLISFTFGDYKDIQIKHTYCSKGAPTEDEKAKLDKFSKKTAKNKTVRQEITRNMAQAILEIKKREHLPDSNADYLIRKSLPKPPPPCLVCPDTETRQNVLYVPLSDSDDVVWNVQTIYAGGDKPLHKEGKLTGTSFKFQGSTEKFLIGEGFATCYAAHLSTGLYTICAFSMSNLEPIIREILGHGVKPNDIVLLADHDGAVVEKEGFNPGMLSAQRLTNEFQIRFISPTDFDDPKSIDFCDIYIESPDRCKDLILANRLWSDLKDVDFGTKTKTLVVKKVDSEAKIVTVGLGASGEAQPKNDDVMRFEAHPITFEENSPQKLTVFNDFDEFPTKESGFFRREMNSKKQMVDVPDFVDFSKWMAFSRNLKANDAFNFFYEDGYYKRATNLELKNITQALVKENTPPYLIAQFLEAARTYNYVSRNHLVEPSGFINLANGVLDVRNKKLSEHSPEFFFKYKLPHEYIEGAECPEWLKFLERTFEGNQELVDVCAEIFGYVLLGGEPFLHKAFVLSGEGRNGKSTFLDVLKYMVGRTNYSSIPVSQLDKPFSVVMADGMLANIVGETTAKEINSEAFKTAVSGEDLIASQKGMPEYPLAFNARLILACNKLPHVGDATTGSHEKFFILPFNRYIQEQERIALYARRYLFSEISGVINWSLRGLDRLILRGQLPKIQAVIEQNSELREDIDSVFSWMKERFDLSEQENRPISTVKIRNLYPNYETWCATERRNPIGPRQFSRRIAAEVRKYTNLRVTWPQNLMAVTGRIGIPSNVNTVGDLQY